MKTLTKLDENVMLVILKLKDNAYIVTIKNRLEEYLDRSISFGALYLSLNRLVRDGYLTTVIGESVSVKGGKAKKYYRLTKEGINMLREVQQLQRLLWEGFEKLADDFQEIR
ncbi:PadR family transcriptional regulator [candidate division KSB1 bacterium]